MTSLRRFHVLFICLATELLYAEGCKTFRSSLDLLLTAGEARTSLSVLQKAESPTSLAKLHEIFNKASIPDLSASEYQLNPLKVFPNGQGVAREYAMADDSLVVGHRTRIYRYRRWKTPTSGRIPWVSRSVELIHGFVGTHFASRSLPPKESLMQFFEAARLARRFEVENPNGVKLIGYRILETPTHFEGELFLSHFLFDPVYAHVLGGGDFDAGLPKLKSMAKLTMEERDWTVRRMETLLDQHPDPHLQNILWRVVYRKKGDLPPGLKGETYLPLSVGNDTFLELSLVDPDPHLQAPQKIDGRRPGLKFERKWQKNEVCKILGC